MKGGGADLKLRFRESWRLWALVSSRDEPSKIHPRHPKAINSTPTHAHPLLPLLHVASLVGLDRNLSFFCTILELLILGAIHPLQYRTGHSLSRSIHLRLLRNPLSLRTRRHTTSHPTSLLVADAATATCYRPCSFNSAHVLHMILPLLAQL